MGEPNNPNPIHLHIQVGRYCTGGTSTTRSCSVYPLHTSSTLFLTPDEASHGTFTAQSPLGDSEGADVVFLDLDLVYVYVHESSLPFCDNPRRPVPLLNAAAPTTLTTNPLRQLLRQTQFLAQSPCDSLQEKYEGNDRMDNHGRRV